ncbi:hypothetical protein HNR08_001521 [Cellulomonas hominis]|uniref:Uncharacterized protein n=1 Tax=Cellulomonas hominis TaxID=156981 RepID=A0A7W8SEY3_9CELL|nr:hypothetical protein [Cellulomonas hominis]
MHLTRREHEYRRPARAGALPAQVCAVAES